ncbi:hypothetical protein [Paenibacillus sp. SAFN-117]|uniref:hypothetical protein n=1 Tax=Paenibacillus sp. SAFN-117 TaxID=3436860 RepID=UPI003F80741E
MKKLMLSMAMLVLAAACSNPVQGARSDMTVPANTPEAENNKITVDTPMTVSETPIPESRKILKIKLVDGKYYEDRNPGPYQGANYEGEFVFEISDEAGEVFGTTCINDFYNGQTLTFVDPFELVMEDYNGDGLPDFTLGQNMNSNGKLYKLFSVGDDDRIRELPVEGQSELYISGGEGSRYSVRLERTGPGEVSYQAYDQLMGETASKTLKWENGAFAEVTRETEVILDPLPETVSELALQLSGKIKGVSLPYFFYQVEDGHHFLAEGKIEVRDNGEFSAAIPLKRPTNGFGSVVFYADLNANGRYDLEEDTEWKLGSAFFAFEESLVVPLSDLGTE